MDDTTPRSIARACAPRRRTPIAGAVSGLLTFVVAIALTACGGGDGGDSAPSFSPAAERGRDIAATKGCAACHGAVGEGGVGPAWAGLPGSQVELLDGSFVVADDAYLVTSIKDPGAQIVTGYLVQMPANDLTDAQIADVIAYIKELPAPDGG